MILSERDKAAALADVEKNIRSFETSAQLLRPQVVAVGSFAGPHETGETSVTQEFPLEWRKLAPEELKQLGADGFIHVLPDLDIREADFVIFENRRYRVVDIKSENLFGAVTHRVIKLELKD